MDDDDTCFVAYVKNEHVQMLSRFPSLKVTSFSMCNEVTDVRPLSSLTSLQELDLCQTCINDNDLLTISVSLTRLIKLDLDTCLSITAAGFSCLSFLTSLQDLNVRGFH